MAAKLTNNFILDTNVLLRFLVGDVPNQQKQASEWFRQSELGKIKIIIPTIVIVESCFVLETFYKKNRSEIADSLEIFISQRWLRIEEREILKKLWPYYRNKLHFVDSYLLAWQQIYYQGILTFDRQILKIN